MSDDTCQFTSTILSNAHKLKDLEHSLPKQNTRPSLLEVCASAKEEGDGGGEGTDWEGGEAREGNTGRRQAGSATLGERLASIQAHSFRVSVYPC